jgi:hypothetical protein
MTQMSPSSTREWLHESFLDEKFNMESIAPLLVVQDPGTGA